jgi:hypothetical protein
VRRVLAALVGAGVVVGGGVAAWASPGGPNREAAKACRAEAKQADPDAGRESLRDAVRSCLEAQGITPREPTPEQRATREALRACLQGVKEANPDADRAELRPLAKPCFEDAGIAPGRLRPRLAELRECREQVGAEHPDAAGADVRRLVKECMQEG